MAIRHQVLGLPGRDNALLVTIDTSQALSRLLFDCGEGVLAQVPVADVQQIARQCQLEVPILEWNLLCRFTIATEDTNVDPIGARRVQESFLFPDSGLVKELFVFAGSERPGDGDQCLGRLLSPLAHQALRIAF